MLRRFIIAFTLALGASCTVSQAQNDPFTFAQFTQKGANQAFVFHNVTTNLPPGTTSPYSTFSASNVGVNFTFSNLTGAASVLNGTYDAILNFSATTTQVATGTSPSFNQMLNSGFFEFKRSNDNAVLLRVDFTGGQIETKRRVGSVTNEEFYEANLCAHECLAIQYSSQFMSFDSDIAEGWAIAMTSISPIPSIGSQNQLADFTAASVGTFQATPATAIPEPSTYALLLGLVVLGIAVRKRCLARS